MFLPGLLLIQAEAWLPRRRLRPERRRVPRDLRGGGGRSGRGGFFAERWASGQVKKTSLAVNKDFSFFHFLQVQFRRRSQQAFFQEKQPSICKKNIQKSYLFFICQTRVGELHQLRRPLPLQVPVFSGGLRCGRSGGRGSRVGGLVLARNRREFTG